MLEDIYLKSNYQLMFFFSVYFFYTRQIHFHWAVEWPDLSLSRVSILHKMAVRLTMIRRFWHLMVTVYSLLDNAPNYLVGCIIQNTQCSKNPKKSMQKWIASKVILQFFSQHFFFNFWEHCVVLVLKWVVSFLGSYKHNTYLPIIKLLIHSIRT